MRLDTGSSHHTSVSQHDILLSLPWHVELNNQTEKEPCWAASIVRVSMRRTKGTAHLFPGLTWKLYEFHMIPLDWRLLEGRWLGSEVVRLDVFSAAWNLHCHIVLLASKLHKYDIWTLAQRVWRKPCHRLLLLSVFSLFVPWRLLIIPDTLQLRSGCLLSSN